MALFVRDPGRKGERIHAIFFSRLVFSFFLSVATFNILHGFPEALVRGMRSSFMADADYHHLTQCENLDDARLNLTETDYNDALADSASMTPASLQKAAIEKVCVCCVCFCICVGKEWMEWKDRKVEKRTVIVLALALFLAHGLSLAWFASFIISI